jgi:uncharacterized membrane protein
MAISSRVLALSAGVLATLFAAPAARAEFKVCNQSVDVYNLAIGAEINQQFDTEGWWVMPANTCVVPIKEDLDQLQLRYVYVYARTVTGESAFQGGWDMCVDTKRFKIDRIAGEPWNCWVRGYEQVKFFEVDTGNTKSWTLYVRPPKTQ